MLTPIVYSWVTLGLDFVFNRSKIDQQFKSLDLLNFQELEDDHNRHKVQKGNLDKSKIVNSDIRTKFKGAKSILNCFKVK